MPSLCVLFSVLPWRDLAEFPAGKFSRGQGHDVVEDGWMVTPLGVCPKGNRTLCVMQNGELGGELARQYFFLLTALKDAEEMALETVPKNLHEQMSYAGECQLLLCQAGGASVVLCPSPPCTLCGRATTLCSRDAAQPGPSSQARFTSVCLPTHRSPACSTGPGQGSPITPFCQGPRASWLGQEG